MVTRDTLKNILHRPTLNKTDKLLICLAVDSLIPKTVTEIKQIGRTGGIGDIKGWNVSAFLSASGGRAVHTGSGWELTDLGVESVKKLAGDLLKGPSAQVSIALREHLKGIKDLQTASFVEEAIRCFELKLYRAAVVLSWVGAVSVLYEYVVKTCLSAFNLEAGRRDQKWKEAKTLDDIAKMKESDFLNILESTSVIGKSVKHELEVCLKLRNGCGHPNSLHIGESRVSAHIEVLILNIFSKFVA